MRYGLSLIGGTSPVSMVCCTIFVRPSWEAVGAKISWCWSRRVCSFSCSTGDKVVLEWSNRMCGFCGKGASEVVSKSGEGGSERVIANKSSPVGEKVPRLERRKMRTAWLVGFSSWMGTVLDMEVETNSAAPQTW